MKKIYLITRQFGAGPNAHYDENFAHVIVAGGPREARTLAADKHMDDDPKIWMRSDYTNCVRIGIVPDHLNQRSRIVLTENTGA